MQAVLLVDIAFAADSDDQAIPSVEPSAVSTLRAVLVSRPKNKGILSVKAKKPPSPQKPFREVLALRFQRTGRQIGDQLGLLSH